MARDHALALGLQPGEAVLRLYRWARPTVSFGRNEPAADRYDAGRGVRLGLDFVRRPTGGRAVLHDAELTYAVVVPDRTFGGPRDAYRAINRGLLEGLRALGVAAELSGDGEAAGLDRGPCFRLPAPGEVAAGGRKLVGSAQVRLEGALLQHGSLILAGDQSLLARLRGEEPGPDDAPATVAGALGRDPDPAEVEDALAGGARLAWGGRWSEAGYRSGEEHEARRLVTERYASPAWTWRR